jgi:purine-binding chemotaxis protein CheW
VLGYIMVASPMNNLTDAEIDGGSEESIRQFRVFRRGDRKFAVTADDVVTVTEWRRPTPLPHAPPAVLGVVSIQGRMLTLLDPLVLLGGAGSENGTERLIVALRGDEQLGLIVDETSENLTTEIPPLGDPPSSASLDVINHEGDSITVMDVNKLFPLAIRGRERRKRGFLSQGNESQ